MSALAEKAAGGGIRAQPFKGRVTPVRVLRAEWTKLWSLRSTRWTLLVSFIGMAGLGPLVAAIQMGRWDQMSPGNRLTYDAINTAVGGFNLAQLAIAVLGVLVISGEYSTGMIRSSLMAVPTRLPVLWAKVVVYAAITFVLMLVASLISFFAVQAIVTQHHVQHTIGDPGALRTVFGAALYMTVLAVMCVGIGATVRNTAAGIATYVALLFVLPGIVSILPSSLDHSISKYLPLNAGTTAATHHFGDPYHLSVWGGFALFCAYAAVAVIAGAITFRRRDA
jgi:ABC-type transport system involved in multi-copper enzyme maturation permease subunit